MVSKITKGRLSSRKLTKIINFWLFWNLPVYILSAPSPRKGPSFEYSLSEHSMRIKRFSKRSTKKRSFFFCLSNWNSIQHKTIRSMCPFKKQHQNLYSTELIWQTPKEKGEVKIKSIHNVFFCSALKMNKYKEKLKCPNCSANCSPKQILSTSHYCSSQKDLSVNLQSNFTKKFKYLNCSSSRVGTV